MVYKNAWNCRKCPQRNDESGCPAWVEYMQENTATGEQRLRKECLFQALPVFMIETIKAANRPAAAMESTRNELAQQLQGGFVALRNALVTNPQLGYQGQSTLESDQ